MPSFNKPIGLFWISETFIFVLSIIGVFLFMYKKPKDVYSNLVLLVVLSTIPVVIYKNAWHYLFIAEALLIIYFVYFLQQIRDKTEYFKNSSIVAIVLCAHGFAFCSMVNQNYSNYLEYTQRWRPYVTAINTINYDEKIALVNAFNPDSSLGTISQYLRSWNSILKTYKKFFVVVKKEEIEKIKDIKYIIEVNKDRVAIGREYTPSIKN